MNSRYLIIFSKPNKDAYTLIDMRFRHAKTVVLATRPYLH